MIAPVSRAQSAPEPVIHRPTITRDEDGSFVLKCPCQGWIGVFSSVEHASDWLLDHLAVVRADLAPAGVDDTPVRAQSADTTDPECTWNPSGRHERGLGRDRNECQHCDTPMPAIEEGGLVDAENVIRSGRIPLDDVGSYGRALSVLLTEYDRRGEAERALTVHWYRDRDEMLRLRIQREAALALHYREGESATCMYCRDTDEEPSAWPCDTARSLGVEV